MMFISSTTISYALLLWTTISSTSTTTTEAWMISTSSSQSSRHSGSIVSNSLLFHKHKQTTTSSSSSSSYRKQKNHHVIMLAATDDDGNGNVDDFPPTLNFFNSLTKTKEPLQSLIPGKISMYTCGPTVYDYAHVGNFRAFLTYDLIKRALLYFGYDVIHVCNLTDVDDKIINRANELNINKITDLTLKYEKLFMEDLDALNVIKANKYPRATEHINEMMDMILALESKGLAYEAEDGSWYFNTANQDGYGTKLVNLNVDGMETTERGENFQESKRNSQDFVLWKAYKPGIDRDDAVWSSEDDKIQKGRPGWHLECSAMSRKYLGDTIDIHGGGIDLKFPHHENEIAQSEGVTSSPFCNCWMHNGFVNINDEKMSKSLGNFLTLKTACTTPLDIRAYRYLVISSQYRNPLSFTPDVMKAAKKSLKRIDTVKNNINMALAEKKKDDDDDDDGATTTTTTTTTIDQNDITKAINNFEAALKDDLSMPRAAASLFNLIKLAEKEFKRAAKEEDSSDEAKLDIVGLQSIDDALQKMDQVFGIFYEVPLTAAEKEEEAAAAKKAASGGGGGSNNDENEVPEEVIQLVVKRTEAKEAKDWELADSLRSRITELGFSVKDVKGGEPIVSRVE